MKISTKLILAVSVPAAMALVTVIVIAFSFQSMQTLVQNGNCVREIRDSITNLNNYVYSYLLYHEDRPRQQFVTEYNTLNQLIAGIHLHNPDQQILLHNINLNSTSMNDLFQRLVANYQAHGLEGSSPSSQNSDAILQGNLMVKSRDADVNASQLKKSIEDDITYTQIKTVGLIIGVTLLLTIPLTIVLIRMRRSITTSLSSLRRGTEVIGAGNLDYRMHLATVDELGDLAQSFNNMTQQLKNVTVSKAALQDEIEERRKAEAALKESEERFLKAFHASPVAQTIAHLPDGQWVEVNDSFLRMLEFSREEVIGHTSSELKIFDPSERARLLQAVSEKGSIQNHELTIRTKTGKVLSVLSFNEKINLNGQEHSISTIIDITERKEAEEVQKRYAAELESSNQELEAFAYSVSHDLRQPLRAMDGFSQAVIENLGGELDETNKDYLERVRKASQTMGRLIDDLLKLSRITRIEMSFSQVNLSELGNNIAEDLRKTQPERQAEFIIAPELIVNGDRSLLNIALRNLMENAWKFTGKGAQTRIEIGKTQQPRETVYFVLDNGAGFDMKYYDKLFQPFQRLHSGSEYEGTGIGLATVSRVIRRHGGRVWAESEVGKGTTIFFTLEES